MSIKEQNYYDVLITYLCYFFNIPALTPSVNQFNPAAASAIEQDPKFATRVAHIVDDNSARILTAALIEGGDANTRPSSRDLLLVALNNCIPFIGFGFIDNALMIVAGDYIDVKFGVILGISTLAAAGLVGRIFREALVS